MVPFSRMPTKEQSLKVISPKTCSGLELGSVLKVSLVWCMLSSGPFDAFSDQNSKVALCFLSQTYITGTF